jgi:hypothetical protein
MHVLRQLSAWWRAADAALEQAEYRPPSPVTIGILLALLMPWVVTVAFAAAQKSVVFAEGFVAAFGCFSAAGSVAGVLRYRRWLQSQRRNNGQCVECGFDLRCSSEHCPECGRSISDADRKHMTVKFVATGSGAVTESGFVKVWLASTTPRHLLSLQRATGSDDSQTYVVYDLEPHSTAGRVISCSIHDDIRPAEVPVTSPVLRLELAGYFNNRYDVFEVELQLPPEQREVLTRALEDVLRGTDAKLDL